MAPDADPKAAAQPEAATEPVPAPEGAASAAPGKEKPAKAKKGNPLKGFLSSRTPRETTFLKATGLVIALVIVDLSIVRPVSNRLAQIEQTIRDEEKVIPKRLMILKYKDRLIQEYRSWKPFMTDPNLSQEEETAQFLRDIERVSKESNLFVSNINPVKVNNQSDSVYELSVDIEGKGGMDQVRRFMKTLESTNPSIRIDGFNFRPQSKESEDVKYSFTIAKLGVREKSLSGLTA